MSKSFQNLISGHWQEILLVLIPVLLIRLVRYYLHKRKMNKKLREEKELAARLMQDEALNDEILNPGRKEGDVEEKKYPYKVSYAENGRSRRSRQAGLFSETGGSGGDIPAGPGEMSREQDFHGNPFYENPLYENPHYENSLHEDPAYEEPAYERHIYERPAYEKFSHENNSREDPFHEEAGRYVPGREAKGRRPDQGSGGMFLKVEEHTGFSVKSYMYRQQEVMRVGNRFGKTDIIAGDTGGCTLYFEIYCRDAVFCVRSFGNAEVTIQRGRQRKSLGSAAVVLRNDDRIKVEDRIYVVSFV